MNLGYFNYNGILGRYHGDWAVRGIVGNVVYSLCGNFHEGKRGGKETVKPEEIEGRWGKRSGETARWDARSRARTPGVLGQSPAPSFYRLSLRRIRKDS